MARLLAGAPAIAVCPNQSEYIVVDAGQLRVYATDSGKLLASTAVALGEADAVYLTLDRIVVVVRSGEHTWAAVIRRKDLTILNRVEIAGSLEIFGAFSQRLILVDPARERPRLATLANDSLGIEPLQVRTPLRFACATPGEEVLIAARDEILRWDPVFKRSTAKLHLPVPPNVLTAGFASRQRVLWMVRGDRVLVFRFSDGRPQGELRASGTILAADCQPASSRLLVAVQRDGGVALEQLDLATGESLILDVPVKESFAVAEAGPPWLILAEAAADPTRVPLAPPSILGEFTIPTIKKPSSADATRHDWRDRLRPKRPGRTEATEGDPDADTEEQEDGEAEAPPDEEPTPESEALEGAAAPDPAPAPVETRATRSAAPAVTISRSAAQPDAAATAPATPVRASALRREVRGPVTTPTPTTAALGPLSPTRNAVAEGPLSRHWRGGCAQFARSVLDGRTPKGPATTNTPMGVLAGRFALSPAATTLVQLLYGSWLLGEPNGGPSPVDALAAFSVRTDAEAEQFWDEVCLAAGASAAPLGALVRGRLALRPAIARFLDGAAPSFPIVEGEVALDAPPPPAAYRVDPGDPQTIATVLAEALGNDVALVPSSGDTLEYLVEAQARGAVPLVDGAGFDTRLLERPGLLVVIRRKANPLIDALPQLELTEQ